MKAGAALIESSASLLSDKAEMKTIAPSSLKKMSEFQGRKEGSEKG